MNIFADNQKMYNVYVQQTIWVVKGTSVRISVKALIVLTLSARLEMVY